MNEIKTWQQGKFVDQRKSRSWTEDEKEKARRDESHLVRPDATANAICRCENPSDAKWIASRLNLASLLEWKQRWHNRTTIESIVGEAPTEKFKERLVKTILRTIDLAQSEGIDIEKVIYRYINDNQTRED